MKKEGVNVLSRLLFIAIMFGLLFPIYVQAGQDDDARIKKLEAAVQALQAELGALKAERAKAAKVPPVDKQKVEKVVDEILAQRPLPEMGPSDLRVFWKEGLRFETANKDFKLKFGGRIMNDWGWISEDDDLKSDVGEQEDGTEFRRVRLYTAGEIYDNVEFKLQFDFAGGDADLKDAYLGLKETPWGSLRGGHFKEPFSLDELTSSKYITFIERALPVLAFSPSRNTGFMLFDNTADERMTWAAGFFRQTADDGDGQDDGGYSLAARVTALPIYENKGASLLHLGAAFNYRNTERDSTLGRDAAQFKTRPEAHLFDNFVDTGNFASDHVNLLGFETAWVSGPLSFQGEYVFANADGQSGVSDGNFDGYYVQGSYFLTGEHRPYKTSGYPSGCFKRVKPKENFGFGKDDGIGAWEVAARYSAADLDDGGVTGGKLSNITAGLNWYLNPNTRIMWNYIHTTKDSIGNADIALMRLQIDF